MAGLAEIVHRTSPSLNIKSRMEELVDSNIQTVTTLKSLARELRIRNTAKLLQAARGRVAGANSRLSKLSFEDSVSKQVLAPAYRSTGKSTAKGPNGRLQADLIDYNHNIRNTRETYALSLEDVYARVVRAMPLLNKRPETMNAAMRALVPTIVQENRECSEQMRERVS